MTYSRLLINIKELLAILFTLRSFPHLRGPGVLRVRADSLVNVHVLNTMRSRSPALMSVVREVLRELHSRQLRAEAYWLSSIANAHADKLSRDRDASDWRLRRSVFSVLQARWGPLVVDRFASERNRQLPVFKSAAACPGTAAVDAWRQDWRGVHNYVNPPFSMAALAINKLAVEGASAVLVLPVWRAQPWWARFLALADAAVLPPVGSPLYTHGLYVSPAKSPRWRTAAFYVAPATTRRTGSAGAPPPTWECWPPSARRVPALRPPA